MSAPAQPSAAPAAAAAGASAAGVAAAPAGTQTKGEAIAEAAAKLKTDSKWNVNAWHWEEADLGKFARASIPDMLKATDIPCAGGTLRITKATVDGDAYCNIRKAKKIYGFELKIKIDWEGSVSGDATKVKGTALLPNMSEDQDDGEYEIRDITTSGATAVDEALKVVFQKEGRKAIRNTLREWVKLFKSK